MNWFRFVRTFPIGLFLVLPMAAQQISKTIPLPLDSTIGLGSPQSVFFGERGTDNQFFINSIMALDRTGENVFYATEQGLGAVNLNSGLFSFGDLLLEGWSQSVAVATNPITGHVYVADYSRCYLADYDPTSLIPTEVSTVVNGVRYCPGPSFAVDHIRKKLYARAYHCCGNQYDATILLIDAQTNSVSLLPLPQSLFPARDVFTIGLDEVANRMYLRGTCGLLILDLNIAPAASSCVAIPGIDESHDTDAETLSVNSHLHRVYMLGPGPVTYVLIYDAEKNGFRTIPLPAELTPVPGQYSPLGSGPGITDEQTGRYYVLRAYGGELAHLGVLDEMNNFAAVSIPGLVIAGNLYALNSTTNQIYATSLKYEFGATNSLIVIDLNSASTPTGTAVSARVAFATVTFDHVTSTGDTTVVPIDPGSAGAVPGGFSIAESMAFEIKTTAAFTGPIESCFRLSSMNDLAEFSSLRVLHSETNVVNGLPTLVDRTSSSDFSSRTICAVTTSLSPFYVVRGDTRIKPLYDQTKAHKSGSTVPLQVQVVDASGFNKSSSTLALSARKLLRIENKSTAPVIDSGNANPDTQFRFDSLSGSYIFNLSTKGLSQGRYSLTFFVGSEDRFVHSIEFQVH